MFTNVMKVYLVPVNVLSGATHSSYTQLAVASFIDSPMVNIFWLPYLDLPASIYPF